MFLRRDIFSALIICRNRSLDEEGEDDFHRPLAPYRYKKVPWWYGKQIEKLGKQGKVRTYTNTCKYDKEVTEVLSSVWHCVH